MKIAYLILAHSNPRLLERVIKTLSSDNCAFFIHIDRKSDILDFSRTSGDKIFFSEPRIPVYWGEFSMVEATMQLIRQALKSSVKYDYFVLLQGADYPIRSSGYIQRFFEKNRGYEFISLVKMPASGYPLSKINKVRYPSYKPVLRFASKILAKLGFAHRDYRKYLGNLEAFAGEACWALSRAACQYVIDFSEANPQLESYFLNTLTCDEVFFHTILGNSPFNTQIRRSLLYTDWSNPGRGFHPMMLNDTHIGFFEMHNEVQINDQFGSGELLFARKFSDAHLDLLDKIDEMIKRKEEHNQHL